MHRRQRAALTSGPLRLCCSLLLRRRRFDKAMLRIPRRHGHFVFGVIQSGLTSAIAAGVASIPFLGTFAFIENWLGSWLIAWMTTIPMCDSRSLRNSAPRARPDKQFRRPWQGPARVPTNPLSNQLDRLGSPSVRVCSLRPSPASDQGRSPRQGHYLSVSSPASAAAFKISPTRLADAAFGKSQELVFRRTARAQQMAAEGCRACAATFISSSNEDVTDW